jgi:hypothetical protein
MFHWCYLLPRVLCCCIQSLRYPNLLCLSWLAGNSILISARQPWRERQRTDLADAGMLPGIGARQKIRSVLVYF